jgi:lipoyl(octanoyl) transferase
MNRVLFEDWGLLDYKQAWDRQEEVFNTVADLKFRQREGLVPAEPKPGHKLIFCEHPHVYTLGKSGMVEHLLLNNQELKNAGATFYHINRGGDITYHGPGQIVGYPIFDLEQFFTDIHKYLRYL